MPNYVQAIETGVELAKAVVPHSEELIGAARTAAEALSTEVQAEIGLGQIGRTLSADGSKFSGTALTGIEDGAKTAGADGDTIVKAAKLSESEAVHQIVNEPSGVLATASELPGELSGLSKFSPAAQAKFAELPDYIGQGAIKFAESDPARNLAFVDSQFAGDTPLNLLKTPERLYTVLALRDLVKPEVFDAVLELEKKDAKVVMGALRVSKEPAGRDLLARLLNEGAPSTQFYSDRLLAQLKLEGMFGVDSPSMRKLLDLESKEGLELNPVARITNAKLVEHLLNSENPVDKFHKLGDWHSYLPSLIEHIGDRPAALERLSSELMSGAIDGKKLTGFIDRDPARAQLVADELERGAASSLFADKNWLPGLDLVGRHFGSDSVAMGKAVQLAEAHRVNPWKLGGYLDEAPEARLSTVKTLLQSNDTEALGRLQKLTMFPQATAEKLAEQSSSGAFRIEELVPGLRDFESGDRFTAMLDDHVQSGKALTTESIAKIAAAAKESTVHINPFVDRPYNEARANSLYLREAEEGGSMSDLAANLNEIGKMLAGNWEKERTVVLLGRDMNALTPVLRANGVKALDFHFSRLQYEDASTVAQWRAEVPPNSVVIDAGIAGSVPKAISQFDPTIAPYLLESGGRYPQLLPKNHLLRVATDLEVFPKITGRCSGFRPSGAAICRLFSEDAQDFVSPSLRAVEKNRALLQELGLSDWWVWRYKSFTGVPQSERIGISDPVRIKQYLKSIADQRAGL